MNKNEDFQAFVICHLRKTLMYIAGDYPNATQEYKKSSFAIGAMDLATSMMASEPFKVKLEFARRIDEVYNEIFPSN